MIGIPLRQRRSTLCLLLATFFICAASIFAQDASAPAAPPAEPKLDTGDTAWMLISTALVLFMTPGLAFFYGGLVRGKNVLGTMMQSLAAMAVIGVLWVIATYSLAFGPDIGHVIGDPTRWVLLNGVAPDKANADYAATIPHILFMMYQGMFAIITPALIGGSIAERMKFKSWMLFMILWHLVVYCPLAHMVWGFNGLLGIAPGKAPQVGALDFAGGTVVHISSGVSALVACLVMGKRREFPRQAILPHNIPFAVLGAGMLWFGWFGFNAGSALASNGLAASAFVNTNSAAAAAALTWLLMDWIRFGKPTAVGTISGGVAGLVGVTPAAGFVTPGGALLIGVITAICCASFVHWRTHRGLDDSLDAFGVHGVGGTIGAILTGVFATKSINSLGSGLVDGNGKQVVSQLIAVALTYVLAGVASFVILNLLKATTGLRVSDDEESMGLDQTQHGETAYTG
ncbi:ammonium transporter [Candidatus Sumerlaeota bacterium]|nr:ammonium transporter [Candidatus Sumerlaeota bacterium]